MEFVLDPGAIPFFPGADGGHAAFARGHERGHRTLARAAGRER